MKKKLDVVDALIVSGLLITGVFALLFHSPRLLLLQAYVAGGASGVIMLISRPFLFYLVRSVRAQNNPARFAIFNSNWLSIPQFRSFYRTLTAVWGCVCVAQFLLHAALAFTLPIALTSRLGSILNIGLLIVMAFWTIHFTRQSLQQARQQRALEYR